MTQKGGNQFLIASICTTSNIYYLLVAAPFKISGYFEMNNVSLLTIVDLLCNRTKLYPFSLIVILYPQTTSPSPFHTPDTPASIVIFQEEGAQQLGALEARRG